MILGPLLAFFMKEKTKSKVKKLTTIKRSQTNFEKHLSNMEVIKKSRVNWRRVELSPVPSLAISIPSKLQITSDGFR